MKVSKSVTSTIDTRFKSLFKALRRNQEFRNLQKSLEYMVINQYNIDEEELKEIFEMS